MAHVKQLCLGAFMSSLGGRDRNKSWEAHERNQQFGENESKDIGQSQRLRKESNATINKVSAMRPGLPKIIEKIHISRYIESPETDHHIAENAWRIDYTDTWSLKQVQWLPNSQSTHRCTIDYWMWRQVGTWPISSLSEPTDYENSPATGSNIQNPANTGDSSQHRMNGPLLSMSWKFWGHSDVGPCGCPRGIQSHCITWSQSTMTCSIKWMVLCKLWLTRSQNARRTCSVQWS